MSTYEIINWIVVWAWIAIGGMVAYGLDRDYGDFRDGEVSSTFYWLTYTVAFLALFNKAVIS